LDFCGEGHDHRNIELMIEYFQQHLPLQHIRVLFNSCVDVFQLPYQAHSWPTHMVDHVQWFSKFDAIPVEAVYKFLCLNRRPSVTRAQLLGGLLDRVENQNVICSFGASGDPPGDYQQYFPKHQLPILLDGIKYSAADRQQIPHVFKQCLFNIIVESSDQPTANVWKSIFITEKTFKCMALRQIPIWYAVPGLVQQVRLLGFDLFDDIVDHSYDKIQDSTLRMQAVLNQIELLDQKWTPEQIPVLQKQLTDRFENNYNRLCAFVKDHGQIYKNFLLDLSRS
jgi:hypothetical protein